MVGNHDWLGLGDEVLLKEELLVVALVLLQDVVQVYLMSCDLLRVGSLVGKAEAAMHRVLLMRGFLTIAILASSERLEVSFLL